ncbi:MAG TPA: DUF971 domain-containing protein [Phycisphaerae bacterium]|nr:DUF971 domain-containing protein [Phycisphaerae bacterium]
MSDPPPTPSRRYWAEGPPVTPTDIKLKRAEQKLILQWPGGHRSELDAATLRQNCPCAGCRTEREKRSKTLLPVLDVVPGEDISLTGAELTGGYAIKLIWSDGHDTGIFDYRYLRSLDPA